MRAGWKSILVVALASAISACATLQGLNGAKKNALRVGTSGTYPPFTFTEGRRLQGVEVDFAKALANEIGRPVELFQVPFPDLIGELNAGRVDIIMSGMSITPRREGLVRFIEPYLEVGQMALVRKSDENHFSGEDWTRMRGLRVGFERGTTGSKYVLGKLKQMEPVEFARKEDGLQALKDGKIDVFVHDAPYVWQVVGSPQSPNQEVVGRFTLLTDEKLAWAVRKDDIDLTAELNGVVGRWRNSGAIEAVLDNWIKVRRISRPIP